MEIIQQHKDYIKEKFKLIKSGSDLVQILIFVSKEVLKSKQDLNLDLFKKCLDTEAKDRYQTFKIKKKSGGFRTINAPNIHLKHILSCVNIVIQCVDEPHRAATGFVRGKSVIENAKMHIGKNYVLNIDLKDFFHSFDKEKVKECFMRKPFNFNGEKEILAIFLAELCTHPFEIDCVKKAVLPQGAPSSPTITNVICKSMDWDLTELANRYGATYTRYADDMTFSSNHDLYSDAFYEELFQIINSHELTVNSKKTRLQKKGYKQEVTGLVVNEKVNVPRRYVKQLRMWIYLWEKYGYEKAESLFAKDYRKDKGHVKKDKNTMLSVIKGKLNYLKMVKGETDPTYKKLYLRYFHLTNYLFIDEILGVWETEGLNAAISVYEKHKRKEMNYPEPIDVNKLLELFAKAGIKFE
ncbi:RNA-directed DNA polymerase [Ornithobacterium rhinotracheale]|uniref:reverse transcriptase family protein n=1 Tax=Ornithobacterium rhinotracheale TaxID=28251 RepID=UPI00129CEDBB|nr:reverse transcriptase family protein [Ornithobacterium rhinotracheale]MRJ11237.1 RNA-directed DNA polymerase [Ornithobacterium rhinotracheale]